MWIIRKKFKFEMAHILDSSYSIETKTFICPICKKENIKNIFVHAYKINDKDHLNFIKKFDLEIVKVIDKLLPNCMSIEIINELQPHLPFLTPVSISNRIRKRAKELNFNTRKIMGKRREGLLNPVNKKGVKEKIAKSVKILWEEGTYINRINGMLNKLGPLSPRYSPKAHKVDYKGTKYFNSFLQNFQEITKCAACGIEKKINIHHIDEDHLNFLPSNLEPLCIKCHLSYHSPYRQQPFTTIGKTFFFAAAHQLPEHPGLCKYLHGHEWKIRIEIRKRINYYNGMVMDFSDLKQIVNKYVINELDHNTLNELLYLPTAENLLIWMWEKLMFDGLLKGISKISIWESKDSVASITIKDMLSVFYLKHHDIIY